MKTNDKNFIDTLLSNIQALRTYDAGRYDFEASPFSVIISQDDIRKGTSRQRIKDPLLSSFADYIIANSSYEVEVKEKVIILKVPPLLDPTKKSFTLAEILERNEILRKLNDKKK